MARINVEDSLFKDSRFTELCIKLGSRTMALGAFVEACILAQRFFLSVDNDRLIPLNEWNRNPALRSLVEVGLAEKREKGVYVAGSEASFAWLIQRSEAGKKLKRPRKKRPLTTDERKLTKPNGSKPPLTPSSGSDSESEIPSESKPQAFVAAYCRQFKARWGVNPPIQGKDSGSATRLAKGMSFDRYEFLLRAYFEMPDAWVVKNKHTLGLFETKLNEIAVFAESGQFTTKRQAQQADDMASNHFLLEKLKREGR